MIKYYLVNKEFENQKEKAIILNIEFVYDPDFVPDWFSKGEIVDQISPRRVKNLANTASRLWQDEIGLKVSREIKRIFQPPNYLFTFLKECHLVQARVKVKEGCFISACAQPLAIYAGLYDQQWGRLPFFGRLTHELIHNFGPLNNARWEIFEDQAWQENREREDFWQNQKLREELVVRKITHQILSECFGQEFVDWFAAQESETIP
jgi:hypothetical protein